MGENDPRKPGRSELPDSVGGVQMADVSVDIETGIVKMDKFVAVQDCGLVVNPRLAESQVNGAVIMGICAALMEERVMDQQTGRMLNADMEFYKLAGIGDIGEIVVAHGHPAGERQARRHRARRAAAPSASSRQSAMLLRMPSGSGCRKCR